MSILRAIALLMLLSTPVVTEAETLAVVSTPGVASATQAPLPAVSLAGEKRPFALAVGIALVAVTFHQAFTRRQRA